MPVNLKQIPDEEPLPTPPAKSRWLLVIILCVITGAMLVLSFWPKNLSTHSAWFWCCALALPFGAGLTAYIIRLRHYENERDRTLWWNHLHQQQRKEHISAGQKAVGILGMSYFTPVASNKLSRALLCGVEGLNSHYSPALQAIVSAALLSPSLKTLTKASYQYRLESNLSGVLRQLASELNQYEGNLLVRLRHDGILHDDQVIKAWKNVSAPFIRTNQVMVTTESDGMMWIDEWLDRKDEAVMLSIESNLFMLPRAQEVESVSALLMASPTWLEKQGVKPQMWVHRPVSVRDAEEAVTETVCWGKIASEQQWYFWRTQVKSDALAEVLQAMDKSGYLSGKKEECILDDILGRPGAAVGNISLICACEHAVASGLPQWVIAGDKSTQMVIVHQG